MVALAIVIFSLAGIALANGISVSGHGIIGVTLDTSQNFLFKAQTQYAAPVGFKSTANKLAVNQRTWKVLTGNDECLRNQRKKCNNCTVTNVSELPDVLPGNNNPLQIYYATVHNYTVVLLPSLEIPGQFFTSPNNGAWANPASNGDYYYGFYSSDACENWP